MESLMTTPDDDDASTFEILRAVALTDQWQAEVRELINVVAGHHTVCKYPPPLCPGEGIWFYVHYVDRTQLECLLVMALQQLATRETISEET
jgi:hypothetical protein